jgi:two-component system cell cycle sensor histidine kinase/response regulator CckA
MPPRDPEPSAPLTGPTASGDARSAKLESLGLLAGGLAHDFNNHLLAILGNADLLASELADDAPGREYLAEIRSAAERAADLCAQLLRYAGKGHDRFEPLDLNGVIEGMVPALQAGLPRRVTLHLDLAAGLPLVDADTRQLNRTLMNLVINASDAIGPGEGSVRIRTGRAGSACAPDAVCVVGGDLPPGDYVFCEVEDTGAGMDASVLERAFDPFYTTKGGRGLGLMSVIAVMRGHRGSLAVRSRRGAGTCLRMCFPLGRAGTAIARTGRARQRAPGGQTVLVVDDDAFLRLLCGRMLRRLGHRAVMAADGDEALARWREQPEAVNVVLLDLVMPGKDGVATFDLLLAEGCRAPVVLSSGYHEAEIARRLAGRGIAGFLQKPYGMEDLGAALEAVLNGRPAPPARAD